MINLREAKSICITAKNAAGLLSALTLRRLFASHIKIHVLLSQTQTFDLEETLPPNLPSILSLARIDTQRLIHTIGRFHFGFEYKNWLNFNQNYYNIFTNHDNGIFKHINGFYHYAGYLDLKNIPLWLSAKDLQEFATTKRHTDVVAEFALNKENNANPGMCVTNKDLNNWLSELAISNDIKIHNAHIVSIVTNKQGLVRSLKLDDGKTLDCDLLIDTIGIARQVLNKLNVKYISAGDCLINNKLISIDIENSMDEISINQIVALESGYLKRFVTPRCVRFYLIYNKDLVSDNDIVAQALALINDNSAIIQGAFAFKQACINKAWIGNIISIGNAFGFIEPIESANINILIDQLSHLVRTLAISNGVITDNSIENYNQISLRSFVCARDYTRMVFDKTRSDSVYWQKIRDSKRSKQYTELVQTLGYRTLRYLDLDSYHNLVTEHSVNIENWLQHVFAHKFTDEEHVKSDLSLLPEDMLNDVKNYVHSLINN